MVVNNGYIVIIFTMWDLDSYKLIMYMWKVYVLCPVCTAGDLYKRRNEPVLFIYVCLMWQVNGICINLLYQCIFLWELQCYLERSCTKHELYMTGELDFRNIVRNEPILRLELPIEE